MTITTKIREIVRDRAEQRCEYCSRMDYRTGFPFHVDHIISKKHDGGDNLDNLAWSCFNCNVFKGTDIASIDRETDELILLYNPRKQQWVKHFSKDDLYIKGITPIGRVTVRILQMNHEDQIEIRELLQSLNLW